MAGPVQGAPGVAYSNRTDLNAGPRSTPNQGVHAAGGQPYGQRGQQEAAQQALPLPNFAGMPLNAPSARPNEPITRGMDSGPGLSAAQAGIPVAPPDDSQDVAAQLRAVYSVYPTSDLADLIATLTNGQ